MDMFPLSISFNMYEFGNPYFDTFFRYQIINRWAFFTGLNRLNSDSERSWMLGLSLTPE